MMTTEWPPIDKGGLALLEQFLEENQSVKLVTVDVLQKIRGRSGSTKDVYAADYETASALKSLADRREISLLLIHHLRKAPGDDPLDEVSGSTGLTGAVDTILVLKKEKGRGLLYVRGRDVEEKELVLDRVEGGGWILIGDAEECRRSNAQEDILEAIRDDDQPTELKDIIERTGLKKRNVLYSLDKLLNDGIIRRTSRGLYVKCSAPFAPLAPHGLIAPVAPFAPRQSAMTSQGFAPSFAPQDVSTELVCSDSATSANNQTSTPESAKNDGAMYQNRVCTTLHQAKVKCTGCSNLNNSKCRGGHRPDGLALLRTCDDFQAAEVQA
jgi:hypothetical protein